MANAVKEAVAEKIEIVDQLDEDANKKGRTRSSLPSPVSSFAFAPTFATVKNTVSFLVNFSLR